MIGRYGRSDNAQGIHQVLTTLVPYVFLWWLSVSFGRTAWYVLLVSVPLLILFTLRVFALMHECGHRSLFRSVVLNRTARTAGSPEGLTTMDQLRAAGSGAERKSVGSGATSLPG